MIEMVLGFMLLVIGLIAVSLQRIYSIVPVHELKRLASRQDQLATVLYRAVAYGASLRLLLWIIASIAIAGGLVMLIFVLPPLASFIVTVVILSIVFVSLPSLRLTHGAVRFATWFVPTITWILSHAHPLLERFVNMLSRIHQPSVHSGLYEKEDLLALVTRQKEQADNRIDDEALELTSRVLILQDTPVYQLLLPRSKMFVVNASDHIGPILLNQLHEKSQSSFLVYTGDKENIIGTLNLEDAVKAREGGKVLELVRNDLIYVHEDFTIRQTLSAFHKTGHRLAVVINSAEDCLGIITLEIILNALLGEAVDDTTVYGDRAVVAQYRPAEPTLDSETVGASPEATEVIK